MRRSMVVGVVVLFLLAAGASYAQGDGPKPMPEKVRNMLEKFVGTWTREGSLGDGDLVCRWNLDEDFIIFVHTFVAADQSISDMILMGWDGVSEDGIRTSRMMGTSHQSSRFKVVSDTVMSGDTKGILAGKTLTAKMRFVHQGPDQFTIFNTDATRGGETLDDATAVYTRVKTTSDEEALIQLQQEWCRAEMAGDVATVDRLLADEYVLTLPGGTVMPKAEYLQDVRSEDTRSTALSVEGSKVRLYGDMAVVKGIVKWTSPTGKKHENLFTETWMKRDGRWQCLGTHESKAAEAAIDTQKLSPEMKKLVMFAGDWVVEGERLDPPFPGLPPAGKYVGNTTCRFVLGGSFLESKMELNDASGMSMTWTVMTGYDAQAKNYVESTFMGDGDTATSVVTISPDGRTWTSRSPMPDKMGKGLLAKQTMTFSPNGTSNRFKFELSDDDGKTWKLWIKDQGKKL